MRKSSGILLTACLLVAAPAFAGNLGLEGGKNVWTSTQCPKPNPPGSILRAHPETSGSDMNVLMAQHNIYVDAMQAYMNCISNDAQHDQTLITQTITSSAQQAIAQAMAELDQDAASFRGVRR